MAVEEREDIKETVKLLMKLDESGLRIMNAAAKVLDSYQEMQKNEGTPSGK